MADLEKKNLNINLSKGGNFLPNEEVSTSIESVLAIGNAFIKILPQDLKNIITAVQACELKELKNSERYFAQKNKSKN